MTRIVAVSGSRRTNSTTRTALEVALGAAADAGAETGMIDLGAVDLPLYHPDEDGQGDSEALLRRVREADGVLAGTPVYRGSYGGTLEHLRSTFRNVHAWTVPHEVGIRGASGVVEGGESPRIADDDVRERTERLGRVVAEHAERLQG